MKVRLSNFSLAIVLAALGLTACGPAQNAPIHTSGDAIIGGVEVEAEDPVATYTALLVNQSRGSICTVSILNSHWVLTAAHCIDGGSPRDFAVMFDRSPLSQSNPNDVVKRSVEIIRAHPRFKETINKLNELSQEAKAQGRRVTDEEVDAMTDWGDVAILKLTEAIPATARPAKLLAFNFKLEAAQPVLLAGYGITNGIGGGAGTLRKVDVAIEEPIWGSTEVLLNQKSGKGACRGDSGGPAYIEQDGELHLFGITSRGVKDKERSCLNFAAYTDLRIYGAWIAQTMLDPEASDAPRIGMAANE